MNVATYGIKINADGSIRGLSTLDRKLDGTEKAVGKLDRAKQGLEATAKRVGVALGVGLVGAVAMFVRNTSRAQAVQAQLNATLRATGNAAGQSIEGLNAHAAALQKVTTFGDEAINAAQARLLSYTGIVGKEFPRATEAVLDYAAAFNVDLVQAAEAVGKALNFPSVGMEALRKQGFILTQQQREQIKYFEETNQLAKAQAIIFDELEGVTKGVAAAMRNTLGGAFAGLKNAIGDLFEAEVSQTSGIVGAINWLTAHVPKLRSIFGSFVGGIELLFLDAGIAVQLFKGRFELAMVQARDAAGKFLILLTRGRHGAGMLGGVEDAQDAFDALVVALGHYRTEQERVITGVDRATAAIQRQTQAVRELARASGTLPSGPGATRPGGLDTGAAGLPAGLGATPTLPIWKRLALEFEHATDDIAENFREQMQISMGRFFSDFFRNGLTSIRSFWESFKTMAFDTLGQIAAKNVMERVGNRIQDRLDGVFGGGIKGAIGAGLAVGGAIAIAGAVADKLFGRSKWEETIGAINKAIRAQAEAAADMAQAAREGLARWRDDFLNFANTETPEERQVRNLTNQRNALAMGSFDVARSAGVSFTARMMNFLRAGDWDAVEQVAGSDSFGNPEAAQAFVDSLRQLREAFDANIKAVERMAAAERVLALTRTIEGLEGFRRDLRQSDLSIYSPFQQKDDAEARYLDLVSRAQGGDQTAAEQLPAAARAFLEQSRRINASGSRYVADFQRVEADALAIQTMFEEQRSAQQLIVDSTEATVEGITTLINIVERQDPYLEAQVTLQQAIATAILGMRDAIVDELQGLRRDVRLEGGDVPGTAY